jgi:DNA-binding MarR family transcriptional regulator
MRTKSLSTDELRIWHAFKMSREIVVGIVARDIAEATRLSGADFGVLSLLEELGGGELRQQVLATSMHWDKTRLSHQLTRMQSRGLVLRRLMSGRVVIVQIAKKGREVLAAALPVHAAAIRRNLLEKLTKRDIDSILETFTRLTVSMGR